MNKKGNVGLEVLLVMVILISLIIAFPLIYSYISPILTNFGSSSSFSAQSVASINNFNERLPTMLDNIFLITLILFWVGGILLAYFIDTHPIFLVISLILVIVVLYTGVFLGDFAEKFINTDAISLARTNLPITTFVSSHILEFMIGISFSYLIALFAKTRRGAF